MNTESARYQNWIIRNGKLLVEGKWVFLKIGKPLRNFADVGNVSQLTDDLDIFKSKHYNCLELNCYWHHFDVDGDGVPDKSLQPLRELIDAIYAKGLFPCLSVETYGVGGGQIPSGFWEQHPDAMAVNGNGKRICDTEYGTNARVPSIFCEEYRKAAHTFIRQIASSVDTRKVLYFETTVEPQYMGAENLCYSTHAKREYELWLQQQSLESPEWPEEFPIPNSFKNSPVWNRFRAEFLAKWINDDASAYREAAGEDAYVAVDYLETGGPDMVNRNGDSLIFLRGLTCANVIQVNWHWLVGKRAPNQVAYDNVRKVIEETGRDWAVTEHMTFNGSDYSPNDAPDMLNNTIAQGTRFGWEFVDLGASENPFSVYRPDWSPKPLIAVVDENWDDWKNKISAFERQAD